MHPPPDHEPLNSTWLTDRVHDDQRHRGFALHFLNFKITTLSLTDITLLQHVYISQILCFPSHFVGLGMQGDSMEGHSGDYSGELIQGIVVGRYRTTVHSAACLAIDD